MEGTEIMALKRWGEEYSKWAHTGSTLDDKPISF
jgi:hypothetical protein